MKSIRLLFFVALPLAAAGVRIIQTNSAGDNVQIIDAATDKVVGEIAGIEVNHGAAAAPDGSRYFISNEAEATLDVADARSFKVTRNIKLSGRPNNIAISKDGRRVYVSIIQSPGAVDVIDTQSLERVKTIPMKAGVHNTYVTPDGRWVVAGSVVGKYLAVIDPGTDKVVWELPFDNGVRPMAFEQNADGSTRRIFVQLSNVHGFAVVDFATHK
jgi:DNA-binding beta-propeller fold protein YncE